MFSEGPCVSYSVKPVVTLGLWEASMLGHVHCGYSHIIHQYKKHDGLWLCFLVFGFPKTTYQYSGSFALVKLLIFLVMFVVCEGLKGFCVQLEEENEINNKSRSSFFVSTCMMYVHNRSTL